MLRPTASVVLVVSACVFPTDHSKSVFVTLDRGPGVVGRGDELVLRAHAWLTASDGSTRSLEGATFRWSTSDASVASVAPGEGGRATVTGVRTGTVRIAAVPEQLDEATPGEADIRVANPVEIDRVDPETVRFGEQLTVYGVGLNLIDRLLLGEAPLELVGGSFTGDSAGVGSVRYWVPASATTQRLLASTSEGVVAASPDRVDVIPEDIYETGTLDPVTISLDGSPVSAPDILFYNPGLVIEGVRTREDSAPASDFFRFTRSSTASPLTITIKAAVLPLGRFEANINPDPPPSVFQLWEMGVQSQTCTFAVIATAPRSDSVIRVLEPSSTGAFRTDVVGDRGGYSVAVRDGAPPEDPAIPADRFEYNDQCVAAERNFQDPERRIDLNVRSFDEILTISRPFDIDWYRFEIESGPSNLVSVRLTSLPSGAADSSDLDLYIVNPNAAELVASSTTAGSSNEGVQFLSPDSGGDFQALVIDQVGVPIRYSLCISFGTTCAPLAGARRIPGPSAVRRPGSSDTSH